ncbi:MAG: cysteine desulfurase NifS, partial [Candidatus Aenigmarchaeota archaeon]|nr:cysteine desulfurase NifS [Candidatus Aenigmarchaeota archaeon]
MPYVYLDNAATTQVCPQAAEVAHATMEKGAQNMARLRDMLIDGIENAIPHTKLNGPRGNLRLPNNANISFGNIEG